MEEMGGAQGNIATDAGKLRMLKSRFPNLKIVGRRWVLTPKEPDFKARLVVQGCQEDPSMMCADSPTGSRDSFFLVLSCAAQEHWSCGSADAASAYLQAGRIERLLLLMMPKRQPPPGCEPGELRMARGSIYGARDAGRSWYQHLRDNLASKFRVHESALEKGLYFYEFNGRLTFVTVTHVDDLFYACDTRCKTTKSLLGAIVKEFNMSQKQYDFVFCGRRVRVTPEALIVSQELAASSLAPMELCGTQRSPGTMLTHGEHRKYRSLLGKLQWLQLQSHPDLSYEVNRAAQRSSAPTVADVRALTAISLKAQRSSETTLRYPRGVINVSSAQLVTYGDASFANMEGSKSQCVVIVFLTHEPRRFRHGEFQLGHKVYWTSSTIKRVVRSTLAAEAYSVSEAVEEAQWLRSVLADLWPSVPSSLFLPRSLRTVETDSLRRPIVTPSDSFNLCQAVKSDKGTGSDKRLRIVRAMLRQVFCGAQGATLAFVTTATMLADALTKALVHCPSLPAAMNARRHVFVTSDSSTGVKTTLPMPSEPMPTLKRQLTLS